MPEKRKAQGLKPLSAYLTYGFVQNSADWFKNAGKGEFVYTNYEARPCELRDYADGDKREELYHVWDGFFTLCPEWKNTANETLSLLGDPAAMIS